MPIINQYSNPASSPKTDNHDHQANALRILRAIAEVDQSIGAARLILSDGRAVVLQVATPRRGRSA
jgi:hypothetical protein